jgi:deoxyhypusine monooxygenase
MITDPISTLCDGAAPMHERFNALFALRSLATDDAIDALLTRLDAEREPSALMRHEVAFALGQMQTARAIPRLTEVLGDELEDGMVRHECAEALGAIGLESCRDALMRAVGDNKREVRETAELALKKLEHRNAVASGSVVGSAKERASASADGATPFLSVDPVPAMDSATPMDELRALVLNDDADMWSRYGAMFALRNKSYASAEATTACADVLGAALANSASALLKHEVCYVLGQLQSSSDQARASLVACLEDTNEHPMVRHEAAEALGSIADPSTEDYLNKFAHDSEPIISQSCEVALEIMRQEREGVMCTADGVQYVVNKD